MSVEIPEGFDLEAAKQAPSTTSKDERPRCPECKRIAAVPKTRKEANPRGSPERYFCDKCGCHFNDPAYGATPEEAEQRGDSE